MKILITGNMGYIGPSVIRELRQSYPYATLAGYDSGFFASCLANADFLPERRMDYQHFGDVRHLPESLLEGTDAVIHLAAISNDPIGNMFEDVTYEINYLATVELAKRARAKGVRSFVYASSCSMYGHAEDGARTELSPLNPLTAYAKTKVFSERQLEQLAGKDFKVTSLRFSTACGMSERLRLDLVLNDFVASAVAGGRITILSDGAPWRPLINIKDMARAIDWAVGRSVENGGEYVAVNVGSSRWNYQVKDLARAVAEVIPGTGISINPNARPDKRSYKVDFSLYERLAPGHQPGVDLLSTIRELKEGLESMGFNDPDFRNSRFIRLNVLRDFRERGILSEKLEWVEKSVPASVERQEAAI